MVDLEKVFDAESREEDSELAALTAELTAPTDAEDTDADKPVGDKELKELEAALDENPAAVVEDLSEAWDEQIDERIVRDALRKARLALAAPQEVTDAVDAERRAADLALSVGDYEFPQKDDDIPIRPFDTKFEPVPDAVGWAVHCAYQQWRKKKRKRFERHEHATDFHYSLAEPSASTPVNVALFADAGTGRYHSLYILKQIVQGGYDCAIHLGDVYYKGTAEEYARYLVHPLAGRFGSDLFADAPFFMLHENHDILSRSKQYHHVLDTLRSKYPGTQVQEGSYFCLESGEFQVIGVDTTKSWKDRGRLRDEQLRRWLGDALESGRSSGKINILLTGYEPYSYGSRNLKKLLSQDLAEFDKAGWIDLWFWGNSHYCALFDRGDADDDSCRFYGSCIGHGGFPYYRQFKGRASPTTRLYLETDTRFSSSILRPELGNNGYCAMRLHKGGAVELEYRDWRYRTRCTVRFERKPEGLRIVALQPAD